MFALCISCRVQKMISQAFRKILEGANPTSRYVISKGVFPDGISKLLSEAASALREEAAMVIDLLILQFKIIAEFKHNLSGKKHPSNYR